MTHLSFEEISELAGGSGESPHTAECETCRAAVLRVGRLLSDARALPRDVAPPPELWSAVRSHLTMAPQGGVGRSGRARWWHNGWLASAAAVLLVIGTATFMALASGGRSAKAKATYVTPAPTVASAALLAVDKNYVVTIRELRSTLESQRSTLAPGTVQTVERSLRVIDDAIAEARAALAADPANTALVDILASHYERQVDLLQRATELSSSL